jgi:predicted nucleotidyltransferase
MRTAASTAFDSSLELDALLAILREHPLRLAILFGSHATDTTDTTGDIDLAVEFNEHRPSDPSYNDVFLGLSADLSSALETDAVDLLDLHAVSPALAESIFEHGILLVGEEAHATELLRELTIPEADRQSPRERIDGALARIDDHFADDDGGVSAGGETEDDG